MNSIRLSVLALLLAFCTVLADDYEFPELGGFASTVIGTPTELQPVLSISGRPFRVLALDPFPDRRTPAYFWYHDRLRYLLLPQDGPAPLIFLIAGTGSSFHSPSMRMLSAAFYLAGFHVVTLPSPTSFQFMVTASTLQLPGMLDDDSRDLLRVMKMAWEEQLSERLDVTAFHLAGFSLGAAQAGYLAMMDEQEEAFGFDRVLMINPPNSLYTSALRIDGFLRDQVTSGKEFTAFWDDLTETLGEAIATTRGEVDLGPDWLYQTYKARRPNEERLAMLIGLAFAVTAQNMVTVADILTQSGYIVPVGSSARLTANVDPYFIVAARTPFKLYFHELMLPFYQRGDPSVTTEALIRRSWLLCDAILTALSFCPRKRF
jgi:pimeloyl-ACP methyl ester carboxylesterase